MTKNTLIDLVIDLMQEKMKKGYDLKDLIAELKKMKNL